MTGPEHYRRAEELDGEAAALLADAAAAARAEPIDWTLRRAEIAALRAHTHAALAQAAAAAMPPAGWSESPGWVEVLT